ncbi:AraC family transcriptional regulator [Flavobacterium sp. ANB]|uniref:helix-turn-helix domain-containing protein n=1 Tax=unclassified Flavobacterium TaxID=196869 RepID=UPI0012B87E2D|nr:MULTISPECIES: helix-turn-helix domain-containing protein [unclassified Flavobacterium]MBF4517407.1 AraC family transcriptional regulator [Flavobacterium sp. ANB]MTD70783.1 helix-turn-helix domain-containing protein [Flavobacterium sp. LC2016-13]
MNLGKEILFFFGALGAFNGIILSIYFFFFTKKKYLTNLFLGAMLLALSVRITVTVFVYFNNALPKTYLQIGLSACLLIGPFLYFFIKSGIQGINTISKAWKWNLIFWLITILSIGFLLPYENYPVLWNNYFVEVIFLQWFMYIFLSGFESRTLLQKIVNKNEKASAAEVWFGAVFLGNAIVFIFYFLGLARIPFISCITGAVSFTFILYLIVSVLLYRKKTDDLFLLHIQKGKKIDESEAAILSEKLKNIMSGKELFKNPNLSLQDLAQELNISNHQLSQFLNNNLGKNFTSFVNEFRINEACKIITSNGKLTLESIGYDVGFNSKSTFFAAFKKHTGTTPLNYQLQILQA